VDQGILQHDPQGRPYWAFGGDFGEKIHDFDFCCNGMVWPDRTPHPAMYEFKKLTQPIRIEAVDLDAGRFSVTNGQEFTDMSWLEGQWELLVDGLRTQKGELPQQTTGPGASRTVLVPYRRPALESGQECHVTLRFRSARATPWCRKGHEVAWEQFALPWTGTAAPKQPARSPVRAEETPSRIRIETGAVSVTIDRKRAAVRSIQIGGSEILHAGPELSLWRAPTDNDGIRGGMPDQEWKPMGQWLKAGYNRLVLKTRSVAVRKQADSAAVVIEKEYHGSDPALPIHHRHVYTVTPEGEILVDNTIRVAEGLPSLPRIGVVLQLVKGLESLEWFGRGPHENYSDRKAGAAVGRYRSTVDEQYVPYVLPQENGNKTDVRWFRLEDGRSGVLFRGDPVFEFSVHHFTPDDLFACTHINEVPRRDEAVVHIDRTQRGLGTGSCGPQTLPAYCIEPGTYQFRYRIVPYLCLA
jgi:beta-galactosidase